MLIGAKRPCVFIANLDFFNQKSASFTTESIPPIIHQTIPLKKPRVHCFVLNTNSRSTALHFLSVVVCCCFVYIYTYVISLALAAFVLSSLIKANVNCITNPGRTLGTCDLSVR